MTSVRRRSRLDAATIVLALVAGGIGAVALLGWIIDNDTLKSVVPGLATMKVNTALAVILVSVGVAMHQTRDSRLLRLAAVLGIIVTTICFLTGFQYATGWAFGIDELLAADPGTVAPRPAGRMAPATAFALSAAGLSLALLSLARSNRQIWLAHIFAAIPATIGLISATGYAYRIESFYTFGPFTSVAINTAATLLTLSTALLMTRARESWLSVFAHRPIARVVLHRSLALSIGVPLVLGYLIIYGIRSGGMDTLLGPIAFAAAMVIAFTWYAISLSRSLAVAEGKLIDAKAKNQIAADEINALFDAAPVGLGIFDRELRYVRINDRLAEMNGISAADHIGKTISDLLPDLNDAAVMQMQRVLAGESLFGVEHVGTTPAQPGVERTWRANWLPFRDRMGAIAGIALSADEVTDEKTERVRAGLLFQVMDALQAKPRDALTATAALLRDHYKVSRIGFAEVGEDQNTIVIYSECGDGVGVSAIGEHILEEYGMPIAKELRAGCTLVVDDVAIDARTAVNSAAYAAIETRSIITVPLIREERLRGTMYINHHEPRHFTTEEVRLFEEVASRAWSVMEQARIEERLAETSRRLDAVLNNASVAIFLMDERQHCAYMNRAAEELTGFGFAETQGRPLHDVIHHSYPDGRHFPLAECAIDRAFPESANMRGEEVFVHKDGSFYPVAFVASPICDEDSRTIGTIIEVRDVRVEKAAAQALADSEARLRAVIDSSPVGLVFADAQGTITGGNARVEEIIGHPVLPSPNVDAYGEWVSFHADGRQVEAREYPLARVITGDAERAELDVLYRRGDGRDAWIRFVASTVRNANGTLLGGVVASLDIDREKRLTDELELQVARVVGEHQVAMAQLHEAQKLETIGQLTGGMAHDFNNLLTPIMGVLEMMERRVAGEERTTRLVTGALQSAERAKNLVQRLLAFARRQHLETRPVDVATLIEGMRDLIERSIGPTISVEIDVEPSLQAVMADPNQLELALLNVSVNGRDAMPTGGVLRIQASHKNVQSGCVADLGGGNYVCLSVSDTGTGMDADTLRRCIEPFYTSKGVGEGTGLGLSMVHGMMRQIGGTLVIASVLGQGTTMELWLPCSKKVARSDTVEQAPMTPAPRRSTILLVDDEELVRESTADMLDRLGYDVVQAKDGACALELLREQSTIDALVTDYLMPGMTGRELAEHARRDRPGLPVLLITGYTRLDEIGTDLARLEKPFRQAEFAARVAELVGRS